MRLRHLVLILLSTSIVVTMPIQPARGEEKFEMLLNFNDLRLIEAPGLALIESSLFSKSGPVRLLDVRPRADYEAGHIPGSIWVDLKQAQAIANRPGGLTDRDAWMDWITPLGLHLGFKVEIIGDDRQLSSARTWWLLRYLGIEKVGLVNGNFSLWKAQRRPISKEVPEIQPKTFPVDFQTDRLATRDDVLAALKAKDARIIDARTIDEWVGKELRAKRGGHIPAACRVEWSDLVDKDGRFLPKEKLRAKIAAAGVKPGESVIAHCQSGGRASVDAFVFEMLGYPTRNYYLSWSDWGNADDTPITTDDKPASESKAVADQPPAKPFSVEYYYKCKWGRSDEFLALFERNHLPILRDLMTQGHILKVGMVKPRNHATEDGRWDYRVTIVFKDVASAYDPSGDQAIKERLFPDQKKYRAEETRRFEILDAHWDVPTNDVDLDKAVVSEP